MGRGRRRNDGTHTKKKYFRQSSTSKDFITNTRTQQLLLVIKVVSDIVS